MPEKKKIPKLAQVKTAIKTTAGVFKVAWSISPWLLIGSTITFSLPSIFPFINFYIYKLIIDNVIESVNLHQINT